MARVACFGRAGAYTGIACASKMLGDEIVYVPSITGVFNSVFEGDFDYGFVPAENLLKGPVSLTFDCLLKYGTDVHIVDAAMLPVKHAIGARRGHGEIRSVHSKDIAIEQCSEYLLENYPQAEHVNEGDTAAAIERLSLGGESMLDSIAIGHPDTIRGYRNLEVLAEDVGDNKNNKTRFFVVGNYISNPSGNDTTMMVVYPKRDRKRILLDALKIICEDGNYNLTSIHSRPDGHGKNKILVEFKGHALDDEVKKCMAEIKKKIPDTDVQVIGSYPALPFNEPLIKTIGLIGGTGMMGKFFRPFFESSGYKVIVAGRKTSPTYEECVDESDAVIINVPIEYTEEVIRRIGPRMKKGQLLVDNTGVKSGAIEAMVKHTSSDVELSSLHTMFSEKIPKLDGQNIISVLTGRSREMAKELENVFHLYGANITGATPEGHDRHVVLTQGLEHAMGVAQLFTILKLVDNPSHLNPYSTRNSRSSAATFRRIHEGDPHLYATMLKENRFAPEAISLYAETLKKIADALEDGDTSVFEELMEFNKDSLKFLSHNHDEF